MSRALVLNATYEAIGVVSSRRAVVLALAEKVDVLADTGELLASERLRVLVPSVVRLRYFVSVPYRRIAPLSRRAVYARDHGRCQYCENNAESIDHVIPKSRGGRHEWENVVACCRRCNTVKGDRLLSECSHRLRTVPRAPEEAVWIRVAAGVVPDEWHEYLPTSAAA